ncbi:MAG: hypothetical protein RMM53_03645 [Bacteroidia bacterium]|nr:hypothetical protein [Bacteroidia bacterium]MDW8333290.1 hypothetical protein [Bacteroidia bacterium]
MEEKFICDVLNQVYEIEKKAERLNEGHILKRNIEKLKSYFEHVYKNEGFVYEDPLGQSYNITRTDCEVAISGESAEDLEIIEVIKPVIRRKYDQGISKVIQKAVVVVRSKSKEQPSENAQKQNESNVVNPQN